MGRQLTETEQALVANALRIAAEQFDRDAEASRVHPRLAEQFARQAREALQLSDEFMGAFAVEVA